MRTRESAFCSIASYDEQTFKLAFTKTTFVMRVKGSTFLLIYGSGKRDDWTWIQRGWFAFVNPLPSVDTITGLCLLLPRGHPEVQLFPHIVVYEIRRLRSVKPSEG
jgi:hypothetical protein